MATSLPGRGSCHDLLFFSHPIYYIRPSFSFSLPSRNSYPGSYSRLFSPPPPPDYSTCPFIFTARRVQHFTPSWTSVGLCLPTLGTLRSWCLAININSIRRIEPMTSTLPLERDDDRFHRQRRAMSQTLFRRSYGETQRLYSYAC